MKLRILLFGILFAFVCNVYSYSQRVCLSANKDSVYRANAGAPSIQDFEKWMSQKVGAMKAGQGNQLFSGSIKTIPVVFHVIYSNSTENITDAQIQSQVDILNEDFRRLNADTTNTPTAFQSVAADCEIEFCLAKLDTNGNTTNGINRVSWSGSPFSDNYIDNTIKPATIWDPDKYLNIWVVNIQGSVLGWATFPGQSGLGGMPNGSAPADEDGVVLLYTSVGAPPHNPFSGPYNLGRTATHEVGHYLGLRHIWGDGGCSVDDYCGDTPKSDASNGGCPSNHNSCTDFPTDYNDMVQNYMDYTNDACMNIFTEDQKTRMLVVLANSPMRTTLLTSGVCNANSPPIAAFGVSDNSVCMGEVVTISDQSTFAPTSWSWSFSPATVSYVSGTNSNSQNPQVMFNAGGNYNITLVASNGNGADTVLQTAVINVASAGLSLPFMEDFETGLFSSKGWTLTNPDNDITWSIETVSGNSPGSKAAKLDFWDYQDKGERDWLTSPHFDFTGLVSATLTFDHAYARYSSNSDDSLIVYVSTDCGTSWDRVLVLGENGSFNFRTRTDLQVAFNPTVQSDWCGVGTGSGCKSVNLSNYVGSSNVQIRFESYNDYGNNLFLDNINVFGTTANQPPVANFQATTTSNCGGFTTTFNDASGNNPSSWFWDFGDGNTSTSQNPTHTFTNTGNYTVILVATNSFGSDTVVKTNYITVNAVPTVGISNVVNAGCGSQNGSATAVVGGGTPNYAFAWNTNPVQNTATATNLGTGIYTVTVTDANGCTGSATATVGISPGVGLSLPFTENFETGNFTNKSWTIENPDSGITWDIKTVAGNTPGSKAAWMDFYNYSTTGERDYLTTPSLNFSGYTSISMDWEHAYCRFNTAGSDSLIISYSTNCGNTWNKLAAYGENGTGTFATKATQTTPFTPGANGDWCLSGAGLSCQSISLNFLAGVPAVQIRFEGYSDYQNNLYLDNINIAGTGGGAPIGNYIAQSTTGCDSFTTSFNDLSTNPTSWLWDFGDGSSMSTQQNPSHTYAGSGSYTVTLFVSNAFGTDTVVKQNYINVLPNPTAVITGSTDATCGASNGTASAIATGTTGNYTYSWNTFPVQDSTVAVGLPPGLYIVTATDNNNCSGTAAVNIGNQAGPTVAISNISNATCDNLDGSATATVQGGTGSIQYSWNTFPTQNSATATNLAPGNYVVTVTDTNGCSATASATVTSPGLPGAYIAGSVDEHCNQGDGLATASANGGTPPYTFSWSNSQTTATAINLAAGTYDVAVIDSAGCVDSASVTIVNLAGPNASIANAQNATCGDDNGWAVAVASGGTSPYNYVWNTNPTQTGATAANLGSGTFAVVVTDSNGCADTASVSISNTASPTASITAQTAATCGSSNGSATASGQGGNGSLSFLWDDGQTAATATGLSPTQHHVIVTDSAGCSDTAFVTIANIAGPTVNMTNIVDASCGQPNGSATASTTGGTSPFTFSWNSNPIQTTATATNLGAGSYTVSVTDSNNCQTFQTVSIKALPVPVVVIDTFQDSHCGLPNGFATAAVTGGVGMISYSWNTNPVQTTATATGLGAAIYTVTVNDSIGCTDSVTVQIANLNTLALSTTGIQNAKCAGDSTGQATVLPTGGTTPYSYLWSNGDSTQNVVALPAGQHTVTVTDAIGCSGMTTVTITEPTAISGSSSTTPDTSGAGSGTITATLSGGTPPYTYAWNTSPIQTTATATGLTAGPYTLLAMDSNGCQFSLTDTVGTVTGIATAAASSIQIDVYPNPNDGQFKIRYSIKGSEDLDVNVWNALGQKVYHRENQNFGNGVIDVDLSGIAKGVYEVEMISGEIRRAEKIIVR